MRAVGVCVERWDDVMRRCDVRLYVVWAETAVCVKCVCFVFIAGTGGSRRAALGRGIARTGGVARLEQADDGATT